MKQLEIRRHTDNDGDVLSARGVEAAVDLGRRQSFDWALVAASGAQRATQTAACILAGAGVIVPKGVVVEAGFRSDDEDRWRAAYQQAGSGRLDDLRGADPEFVKDETKILGDALRAVLGRLDDGERALVIGHSPTSEAAILGLTGQTIEPLGKGEGSLVTVEDGSMEVQRLEA